VNVAFVTGPDRLEMIVEDEGTGLDPSALPDWDAERGLDSGMGMSIIRAIVDDLDVRAGSDGRGTVVHMTKYLGHAV
jgi:anti-sigma regulatory factor (Ser/Thr protein kinase)